MVANIGIVWSLSTVSGWGVYGKNLAIQLMRRGRAVPILFAPTENLYLTPVENRLLAAVLEGQRLTAEFMASHAEEQVVCDFPVLHQLGDDLAGNPWQDRVRGGPNLGVVFFENTAFTDNGRERARRFEAVIAGSTWNAQVLREHTGATVAVCLQGIDPAVFHPAPRAGLMAGRFVVFSGGKLEYRKGQDIVIAAFRAFHARHPDALLVTAWQSYDPLSAMHMIRAGLVKGIPAPRPNRLLDLDRWMVDNGLAPESFLNLDPLHNLLMAGIIREADVAVFPNRCEGGTNLVAMECMACGVPVILSANTGHLDILRKGACTVLRDQRPVTPLWPGHGVDGWGESPVDEVLAALEEAYADPAAATRRGEAGAAMMRDWTWERQVGRLMAEVSRHRSA
ncbi:MAG: glycosyltransferase family 4 protein [Alphaproteobacteria bacterium]